MSNEKDVVLLTGATGAIGRAIALGLARKGFELVLVCRNDVKARDLLAEVIETTGNEDIRVELADLSLKSSINALLERWTGTLNVLVNCAAEAPRRRRVTDERLERQFATNVMGYFWMMQGFKDILAKSKPSRVVNVASYWAGDLDLDDIQFTQRMYDNDQAYRQSKQANRMLTVAFARRWIEKGITVNACHPGDVSSKLSRDLGFGGHQSPEEGAATPVWLATSDEVGSLTGKYFENQRQVQCRFESNRRAVEQLYAYCVNIDEAVG